MPNISDRDIYLSRIKHSHTEAQSRKEQTLNQKILILAFLWYFSGFVWENIWFTLFWFAGRMNKILWVKISAQFMGEGMEKEHLEVILENIDKKFDIVIEGYSTLDRKIDDW